MPPQTRAFATSVRSASAVAKCRVDANVGPPWMSRSMFGVPRTAVNTDDRAVDTPECALGYSGWFGVGMSGRHPCSSTVAGFPSETPGTDPKTSFETDDGSIADTGRQNAKWYFA